MMTKSKYSLQNPTNPHVLITTTPIPGTPLPGNILTRSRPILHNRLLLNHHHTSLILDTHISLIISNQTLRLIRIPNPTSIKKKILRDALSPLFPLRLRPPILLLPPNPRKPPAQQKKESKHENLTNTNDLQKFRIHKPPPIHLIRLTHIDQDLTDIVCDPRGDYHRENPVSCLLRPLDPAHS